MRACTRRQGEERPVVPRGAASLNSPQPHLEGAAGAIRQLEKRLETVRQARQCGVFEDYFTMLAGLSEKADLVQMFDSTVIRAHVSAAGAEGGKKGRRPGARGAGSARKSIRKQTMTASLSPLR